jgi:hypothetical protein
MNSMPQLATVVYKRYCREGKDVYESAMLASLTQSEIARIYQHRQRVSCPPLEKNGELGHRRLTLLFSPQPSSF